jgi:hypothetical protein
MVSEKRVELLSNITGKVTKLLINKRSHPFPGMKAPQKEAVYH